MPMLAALIVAASGTAALMPPGWSVSCPPRRQPDEIVVCANREPPPSPYRAPLPVRREFGARGTLSVSNERNRLLGPDVGTAGTCSGTWGSGGAFGCKYNEFKANVNQAAGSRDPRGRVYEAKP
ncbi:hypothetical protein CHU93_09655 [Sandarakinorhabdus cyanobacteriorum]|uniref:Uncharacterized protein n=2 Tax=Sandarakinorhabdus cyanobacteriorum TaxID=1981098 RepID=A0A255YIC9_9SPHN|nr:hypothetical protein CHU93_09655 [Sandarakinorhabdus cyanobacteriorum]